MLPRCIDSIKYDISPIQIKLARYLCFLLYSPPKYPWLYRFVAVPVYDITSPHPTTVCNAHHYFNPPGVAVILLQVEKQRLSLKNQRETCNTQTHCCNNSCLNRTTCTMCNTRTKYWPTNCEIASDKRFLYSAPLKPMYPYDGSSQNWRIIIDVMSIVHLSVA